MTIEPNSQYHSSDCGSETNHWLRRGNLLRITLPALVQIINSPVDTSPIAINLTYEICTCDLLPGPCFKARFIKPDGVDIVSIQEHPEKTEQLKNWKLEQIDGANLPVNSSGISEIYQAIQESKQNKRMTDHKNAVFTQQATSLFFNLA